MERHSSGLAHHPDFLKLWFGQTISEFGSRISRGGIPLIAVINLSATPAQMGWLTAAASLPVLIFGLFAGAWVDRLPRRPLMVAMDILRFFLLLLIPAAALLGWLSIELLAVILAVLTVMGVVFDAAYRAYLPQLIDRDDLMEGNAKLATTDSLAEIGGPAITGVLVQAIGAPMAIVVDAFTFLVGAGSKLAIRKRVPAPAKPVTDQQASIRREIAEGIRYILRHPVLRALAIGMVVRSFFGNFYGALYDFYAVRELGMDAATLGLMIAGGGIGALLGAALADRVVKRFGLGRAMIGGMLISAGIGILTPLAGSLPREYAPVLLITSQIIGDGAMMIFWISEMSFRQMIVPEHMLGRTYTSFEFLSYSVAPVAALVAGWLGGVLNAQITLWIAVIGIIVGAIWLARSPARQAEIVRSSADTASLEQDPQ